MQWWQVTASLAFLRLNSMPGWVALHSEVQTRAADGWRLSEEDRLSRGAAETCRGLKWSRAAETCRGLKWSSTAGLNIEPRPAAVCSSHPETPAHTLRCGLELSQEHSEERLDERDWVYSANHRPTVYLLPCLPAVSHIHTQLLECVFYRMCWNSQDPFIVQKEVIIKKLQCVMQFKPRANT